MTEIKNLSDGDTFTHAGLQFIVSIEDDTDQPAPWEREEGHGPVSEWTRRDKKPGEWLLMSERYSKCFYDAAGAMEIAKRERWGLNDEALAALTAKLGRTPTKAQICAEAVRRDFEHLKDWCNDGWSYVGVCVRHVSQDDMDKYSYACWGMESNDPEYLTEMAHSLAGECAHDIQKQIAAEREALKANRSEIRALIAGIRSSNGLHPSICSAVRQQLSALMGKRSAAHACIAELTA